MKSILSLTPYQVWTTRSITQKFFNFVNSANIKSTERFIKKQGLDFDLTGRQNLLDEHNRNCKFFVLEEIINLASKNRKLILFAKIHKMKDGTLVFFVSDRRRGRRWIFLNSSLFTSEAVLECFEKLSETENKNILLIPTGLLVQFCRKIVIRWRSNQHLFKNNIFRVGLEIYSHSKKDAFYYINKKNVNKTSDKMNHLDHLESESIHIMREAIADAKNPAMLYSIGKDSAVMLHLAIKAFYPSLPPFPLLHVDTLWKFQAMYDFRDYIVRSNGMELLVYTNPRGKDQNVNPFDYGTANHTHIMKTEALIQALNKYNFDVVFGGARRDEEKSRAKERVFSFRTNTHLWDPKNQRPELWNQYNGRINSGESIRVFPLSNWTELDIWLYIYREHIPIVPLYFAQERPVVERNGMLILLDDDRYKFNQKDKIEIKKVRFRTLGCYPLTGAVESNADNLASIILELLVAKTSERQGRAIDLDTSDSMEKKKREGYF